LLLQLRIDRFTDQTEAIELPLSLWGPFRGLVDLAWSEQLQTAILLKKALQGRIIEGAIAKQVREVMRTGVHQFHEDLVVRRTGWVTKKPMMTPVRLTTL